MTLYQSEMPPTQFWLIGHDGCTSTEIKDALNQFLRTVKVNEMLNALKNKLNPKTNAVDLLKADHREVDALFEAYESAKDSRKKRSIVTQICIALDAHTKIEEKIFYPAVKDEIKKSKDMVNEAIIEHAGAKKLIRELKKSDMSDEFFVARVTVLKEYIRHHVKEEESDMFPKVEDSNLDLVAIGDRMQTLKDRILAAETA